MGAITNRGLRLGVVGLAGIVAVVVALVWWRAAAPAGQYTGKGAALIYKLIPSLRGMRVAEVVYQEVPAGSRYAGRWSVCVSFCTTMSAMQAEDAIKAALRGNAFDMGRDPRGNLVLYSVIPPDGQHLVVVRVYDGAKAGGARDLRVGAERAVAEVGVLHDPTVRQGQGG